MQANIIRKIQTLFLSLLTVAFVLPMISQIVEAVTYENLPENTVYGDFVVGPGKFEFMLNPGEKRTVEIVLSNRTGSEKVFKFDKEDFIGSDNPEQAVILLGDDKGPYSLKDIITVSSSTITVGHGIKARIPVTISVPEDAQPGGMYGSVIASTVTRQNSEGNSNSASSPIISRIGTLFFIRVAGDVHEEGKLSDFFLKGRKTFLSEGGNVTFGILYENKGNIHLDPHGEIKITNMLGSTVGNIEVDPWFAMPESKRFREVTWKSPFLFGKYTASASIDRGYDKIVDNVSLTFWVIPWKLIVIIFISLFIIILAIRFVFSRFSIVKRDAK